MRKTSVSALFSVIFLLQTGCTGLLHRAEQSQTSAGLPPAVETLVKDTRSWDSNVLPAYPEGQPEITILKISIPPGTRLKNHSHPVINAGVLISGELTVITEEGKTLQLKAGDPIIEVVNTTHYGINRGDKPAEIIVFYAGIKDNPVTVTEP